MWLPNLSMLRLKLSEVYSEGLRTELSFCLDYVNYLLNLQIPQVLTLVQSCVQIVCKPQKTSAYKIYRKRFIFNLWSHMGLNHGPPDYESDALTN